MSVIANSFETFEEEVYWVTENIKEHLKSGVLPNEIAIISRKHATLAEFQTSLSNQGIVINYDKSENLLDNPIISQLITLTRYIDGNFNLQKNSVEFLLAQILSYEFWELETTDLWQLSIYSSKHKRGWLEQILEQKDSKIYNIVTFLIQIAQKATSLTAEEILDLLIGNRPLTEEKQDDLDTQTNSQTLVISPFKKFYFNRGNWDLETLSGLKSLYQAIRSHTQKDIFYIKDMVEYLDLMTLNNLPIYNQSPFYRHPEGVNLLTAHKSKGLEFEIVFVVNCVKKEWEGRGVNSKLSFPRQIQITADKDNLDDYIRLFYVAATRSKDVLILTKSEKDSVSKDKEILSFNPANFEPIRYDDNVKKVILEQIKPAKPTIILDKDLKDLLLSEVLNKKLSVSGLLNYIDVTKGGPAYFLETNLLRFPQAKSPSASYGTAAHASIKELYKEFKLQNKLPTVDYFLASFEKLLGQQNLNSKDFKQYLELGKKELTVYYQKQSPNFVASSILEMNFINQESHLATALITGMIDKMELDTDNRTIVVTDFKTGKAYDTFDPVADFAKQKMWNYRQQLIFYKLMIENSAIYGGKYIVNQGKIEFLKPTENGQIIILDLEITQDETDKLEQLTKIVYQKITDLDFPDTSHYDSSLKGTLAFVDDLLNNKI